MSAAKQTTARLIDQRARRRASTDLQKRHEEEWNELYRGHRVAAEAEALELARRVSSSTETSVTDPPRLLSGAYRSGQKPVDRIDVGRCEHCQGHHDRNHVCAKCGAAPNLTPAQRFREVLRMTDNGATPHQISTTLRMDIEHVTRIIKEAVDGLEDLG